MINPQLNHDKGSNQSKAHLVIRLIVSLLQGAGLYFLVTYMLAHPMSYVRIIEPAYVSLLFVPLLVIQGIGNIHKKKLLVWCLFITVLLSGITYYEIWKNLLSSYYLFPSFYYLIIIGLFVGHALVTSADVDHHFQANYVTQFDMSWKLGLQFVLTFLFVGFFWVILLLGNYILKLIDIKFLETIISKMYFFIPVTTLTIAAGIHLTDVQPNIIRNIRGLTLTLFSWLLPLITLIITLFLIILIFFQFGIFWHMHHATLLLVTITILLIFLINTSYQDGGTQKNTVKIIQYFSQLAALIVTPLAIVATYGLYLRVAQYGWTAQRISTAAGLVIIDMYSVGYTLAVFIRGPWLCFIERWNFYSALLLITVFVAILTPIADPTRLAVEMQVNWLLSGSVDVDKFDFNYLRLQGARFGQKALENLQRQTTGPQAAKIREQAKTALLATPPKLILYVPPEDQSSIPPIPALPLHRATLILINTPNSTLPNSFLNQNWHQNANVAALPSCLLIDKYSVGLRKCDAWLVRIADVPAVILFQSDRPELFQAFQQDSQSTWQLIGQWRLTTNCPKKYLNAVISGGGFKLEAPLTQASPKPDLEILGSRFPFIAQLNEKNCAE